jgi:hypothetical protein
MKNIFYLFLFSLVLISCSKQEEKQPVVDASQPALRHVVLFKFTDAATPEDVKKVETAFIGLTEKISLIKDFEWGTNSSPENLNQGLTHCFFVTFASDKDRDEYLVHPDHQAFVEVLKPHLDKVTVIDYWTK